MKVQFYILTPSSEGKQSLEYFVCRLVEKVFKSGYRIILHLKDAEEVAAYDERLWSFDPDSFVPHLCDSEAEETGYDMPVLLSAAPVRQPGYDVMIATVTSKTPPQERDAWQQCLYIVDASTDALSQARALYRHYQQLGCEVVSHKVAVTA